MWRYILLCLAFFLIPSRVRAFEFTEIAYNAPGSDTNREWVEIRNETDQPANIGGDLFYDGAYHQISLPPDRGGQGNSTIAASQYFILSSSPSQFLIDHPGFSGTVLAASLSLPNYSATRTVPIELRLTDKAKQVLATTSYMPTKKGDQGYTIEKQGDGSWSDSLIIGGTPGVPPSEAPPPLPPAMIQLNEVLSNPVGSDDNLEWVELYNPTAMSVDLSNWRLTAKSASGTITQQTLTSGTAIASAGYLLIAAKALSLSNTDLTVTLERADDSAADQTVLAGKAPDGLSYARFDAGWQWTNQSTPNALNLSSLELATPLVSSAPTAARSASSSAVSGSPSSSPLSTQNKQIPQNKADTPAQSVGNVKSTSPKNSPSSASSKVAASATKKKPPPSPSPINWPTAEAMVAGAGTALPSNKPPLTVIVITALLIATVLFTLTLGRKKMRQWFQQFIRSLHDDLITD